MNKYVITFIFAFICIMTSCQNKFDQKTWLKNNDLKNYKSPRAYMTKDLMENYLTIGMNKGDVIKLLGTPYSDKIEKYIAKNVNPPDSLQSVNIFNRPKEQREKYFLFLNQWRQKNYKSAPMVVYYAGWDLMDPVFLEIIFNEKNKVVDFWLRQS